MKQKMKNHKPLTDLGRWLAAGVGVLSVLSSTQPGAAYPRYRDPSTGTGYCSDCHGAFTDSTSPKGTVFPSNSKHEMHRASTSMATACNLCHSNGDNRNPYTYTSAGTAANKGLGCSGCHVGPGLRAHHAANGVDICYDCHNPETPVPENVKPPYYGTVDTRADNPCNPVRAANTNENWSIGDFVGLDNDGNNLYDTADPACGTAGAAMTVSPSVGLTASGMMGGPISPAAIVYSLTNAGGSALNWTASKTQGWLSLSATSGTLAAGAGTNLTVSINASASTLPAGTYSDVVSLVNATSGNGDTSRTVTLTLASMPTVQLTVTANNPAWGTVNPTNGTYAAGSSVLLTASPATYYWFSQWAGDATGTNNPLSLVLNTNASVLAVFSETLTTNHPTPYWWLAAYGYTNAFETSVTNIGANGLPLWQSHIAGLNPNDPASQLRLGGQLTADQSNYVVRWNSVTNRFYSLLSSTNLAGGFAFLPGASNLSWTIQSFTNVVSKDAPIRFYRLEVRKP